VIQYQSGYILDSILDLFRHGTDEKNNVTNLCLWLSHFDVETSTNWVVQHGQYSSVESVLINILQRGFPTRLNIGSINRIVSISPYLEYDNTDFAINLRWSDEVKDVVKAIVYRSLHIVEPRLTATKVIKHYKQSWERLGSSYEEDFCFRSLPEAMGVNNDFVIQLLANQRTVNSIIKSSGIPMALSDAVRSNFEEQRTDFSIEFPYFNDENSRGLVIEIDGPQHQNSQQMFLDTQRDAAAVKAGWNNSVRIKTSEFNTPVFSSKVRTLISPGIQCEYVKEIINNFRNPLWETEQGKQIFELTLAPFAIARFQRILIEAIACGKLSLTANEWNIAVLERDVPFSQLALDDLKDVVENLNALMEVKIILPKIHIEIFSTTEFEKSKLHYWDHNTVRNFTEFDSQKKYDLVFDVSVLQRSGFTEKINSPANEVVIIRSAQYLDSKRKIETAAHLKYLQFCHKTLDEQWIIDVDKQIKLEFFLQSIFRKKTFLLGQVPIMQKALQCKSVIGLLATGGGKSLTYQLSALLQPGICMVIDPIRSLMKDQVDGLNRNLIDACVLINSTLQGDKKRAAMATMSSGAAQFIFISPERLQMEEFRLLLTDMAEKNLFFNYCVIDEAHCVSEWGHDFRTAYLRLGENAMRYCKTVNLTHVPLFGLTATASYDVLADVQRELSGNDETKRLDEDAIVRFESTKRPELQFMVESVSFPENEIKTIWDVKRALGESKRERVIRLINETPNTLKEFGENPLLVFSEDDLNKDYENKMGQHEKMILPDYNPATFYKDSHGSLVFCPHTKGIFGVTDKFKIDVSGQPAVREGYFDVLSSKSKIRAGYFMGSGTDQDDTNKQIQEESFLNQDKFINNELNLMVATKAFGMGIDKENIRCTIHVNYPGSIESYVQEAGRAGRDRKLALSYILFNEQKITINGERLENDLEVNMYFHRRSFKGVIKELAVLDELLTEIYFPDRTFELENIINKALDIDVKCNYWEGGANKRLYVNLNFLEPLGYINIDTLQGFNDRTINADLSQKIFSLLRNYITSLHLTEPVNLWMLRSDKQQGIEELIKPLQVGGKFKLTIGFYNDVKTRVKTITRWLNTVIHQNFNESEVHKMRANCTDADGFVEEIIKKFEIFTRGQILDFEAVCKRRDKEKGNPDGTASSMFNALFNGYRDKVDTEKAIYRLSSLGIIDDYTVNFSSNTFTLHGTKQTDQHYKANLRNFLLKYYSQKTASTKLSTFDSIDEETEIRKCLQFLVTFVYKEIQKKRELAIHDMKLACQLGLEKGNIELKEYIDLYFNSKYARNGYSYTDKKGDEVNASLADLTDNGKDSKLDLVYFFMDVVDEDPKASQIDNTKHLRGACVRMLRNNPDNYTLLLLSAFALYMLEFKNQRFLSEAETLMQEAFTIMDIDGSWSEKELEKIFNNYTRRLLDENKELEKFMNKFGFAFDFDLVLIKRYLQPLKTASKTMHALNQILN
jgi:ATP-dependent DNA helicase RecQ